MSLNARSLVVPCFVGGILALLILAAQYQSYRAFARRPEAGEARLHRGPTLLFIAWLVFIMLLPVIPISILNDRRWPIVLWGILTGSAWLLAGVIVSAIAVSGSCFVLNKVQGWPRPTRGQLLVHAVLTIPATLGVALVGFGFEALGQARGSYGNAGGLAALSVLALVALLTVLGSRTLRMTWERALPVTILHGLFAAIVSGAVWVAWFALPF